MILTQKEKQESIFCMNNTYSSQEFYKGFILSYISLSPHLAKSDDPTKSLQWLLEVEPLA